MAVNGIALINKALLGATGIHADAQWLVTQAQTGAVPFDQLQGRMDRIQRRLDEDIQPLLTQGNAGIVNTLVPQLGFLGAPADTHAALTAIGPLVDALLAGYETIFNNLTPLGYTAAGGHVYADVPTSELLTLGPQTNALIAAIPAALRF